MCPLWPAHIILLYIFILGPLWLVSFGAIGTAAQAFSTNAFLVSYSPEKIQQLKTDNSTTVKMTFNKTELSRQFASSGVAEEDIVIEFLAEDPNIATVLPQNIPLSEAKSVENSNGLATLEFNVTAHFLGYSAVCPVAKSSDAEADATNANVSQIRNQFRMDAEKCLDITAIRQSGALDTAFTASVAGLVTIIYVNMGAALDMRTVRETIKRPYGPVIGFCSQFLIMPVLSFVLAKLLIPKAGLQLGLFITGCSPGGGASNIWTLTLGGNLDLSITMTTISTFSAFAMMPLWILTLGSTIFAEANLTIPYRNIATFAIALVVPLAIGILIQYKSKKIANFLVRILKPFAIFLIVFIVVFAIYTNLYLFQLFTWQILLAGMLLPWIGYLLGGGAAWLLKQEWRDVIAIGIETGVQNTGLAILALRFSLPQPEADLTTALPVAVAMMTPVIPAAIMIYQKLAGKRISRLDEKKDPMTAQSQTEPLNVSSNGNSNGHGHTGGHTNGHAINGNGNAKQYGSFVISANGDVNKDLLDG